MAVRVKLEIDFQGKNTQVSALANAGYETDEDEILVPKAFANEIGITKGRRTRYHTAGGDVYFIVIGKAKVKIVTEDRESKSVWAKLVISPYEDEVIINDKLVEDLDIELVRVKSGIWRFSDDPLDKGRLSEPKQTW